MAGAPAAHAQAIGDGVWTGITRIRNGLPIGAVFTVATSGGVQTMSIKTLSCADGCPLSNPNLIGDTLTFGWAAPDRRVECRLIAQRSDRYRGNCLAGRDTILMTMRGPEIGEQAEPLGVARYLLDEPGARWERLVRDRVRLYAPRGSRAAARLEAFASEAKDAVFELAVLLQLPAVYTEPVDLFFVDSRRDMQRLIGASPNGFSDPVSRTAVLVVDSTGYSPVRHELTHILSWRAWGPPGPFTDWMLEGFAVFADWRRCREEDLHGVAGYLEKEGQLITIDALVRGFRDFDNSLTYLQGGSLVHFAFERFGIAKFRDLWHRGMDNLTFVTAMTLPQLDEAWRAWIRQRARVPQRDWRRLIESGCR